MKQLLNYCKSCTLEQIAGVKCSIAGLIRVSENYSVSIETKELSRELYQQMKHNDNDVIYLKTVDQYVTIMGYWVTDKHTRGVENVVFSITCEAKKSFWGSQYCNVHDNCFEEFFMQVTEGTELIGLTPYGILDTEDILFHIQSAIYIDTHMRTIGKKEGFSCFAAPEVQRIGADIRLGIQYGINYSQGSTLSISNVEEKIHSFILFLEILCGERISVTNIEVWIGKEMYKYLGLPMIPKERLNTFDREQFDSRGYVRRKIFKLSDFNQDIDEVICQFEKMYVEDRVAFEAYQQLMMDEELQIFTVNNFLKAMQMVEGIERLGDRESIEKEFKKEKHRIMKKLTDEKDKEFVKIYCNNLGETFRECLEKIVESCLMALSETDNSSCGDIITKMVNDRNVYTHASHKNDPLLSQTDLRGITYCFEVFFRIEVLIHLGLSKELIRKRCSYDRRFVAYYENLFGQTIGEAGCHFIIKRNLCKESKEDWLKMAQEHSKDVETPRDGKTVYIGSDWKSVSYKPEDGEEKNITLRTGYEIINRTIDKYGQFLLEGGTQVNTWWTNLGMTDREVIGLYHAHGECEQFHSEIKTDMDVERLPSGKFETNELVLELTILAYNILRMIGQESMGRKGTETKHKVRRRRLRTVIGNMIMMASHVTEHARQLLIGLGRSNVWRHAFAEVYTAFADFQL